MYLVGVLDKDVFATVKFLEHVEEVLENTPHVLGLKAHLSGKLLHLDVLCSQNHVVEGIL